MAIKEGDKTEQLDRIMFIYCKYHLGFSKATQSLFTSAVNNYTKFSCPEGIELLPWIKSN